MRRKCHYIKDIKMVKKFFITMLGTIAGFWISLALIFIIGIGVVGAIIASGTSEPTQVSKKSILYLDLSGEIIERTESGDLWQILRSGIPDGETYIDIINSVRLAKNDSKIEGIYINAAGSAAGFATREEIVDALRDFKESGKWIYAYSDGYSQGDYLLATVADSVFVNPVGGVDVHGVASQTPFFTKFLEKIGVKMTIVRVGTYKSAVEPFMTTEMSAASREQTQVMLDSLWAYYVGVVSHDRRVEASTVNQWADSMISMWDKKRLEASGAVSAQRYRRNVESLLRKKTDKDNDEGLALVTPSEYMMSQTEYSADRKHIAVLFATGDIVDSGEGGIVGDVMTPEIISLADNDNVEALVLRVNSGGGSGFASEQIWEALEYFKSKGKPFYVSMGDYAASGGYYISCGADRIFADHTTLTGSIGVFGMIPNFSGLVTDKLGITFSTVETNPNASFPSPFTPMTAGQEAALQGSVENFYDLFTSRVAAGRGMTQDDVKKIAEGRVWVGGDAKRLGLIDEFGGLTETIEAIAKKADLEAEHVVYYPRVKDKLLLTLMASAKKNISVGSTTFDEQAITVLRALDRLSSQNPIQARMPELVIRP